MTPFERAKISSLERRLKAVEKVAHEPVDFGRIFDALSQRIADLEARIDSMPGAKP